MKVLFDQGTPVPLRSFLTGHEVKTVHELGWSELKNGELLVRAEVQFDAFVTTDQNLRYQQNLSGRTLAILVLPTTSWPRIRVMTDLLLSEVNALRSGDYREIQFGPAA